MSATPNRRPSEASSPMVLNENDFKGRPTRTAAIFWATTWPSRMACCAVARPHKIQDTGDYWSHKHVLFNGADRSSLIQPIWRIYIPYLRVSPHEHGVLYSREWNKSGRSEYYQMEDKIYEYGRVCI